MTGASGAGPRRNGSSRPARAGGAPKRTSRRSGGPAPKSARGSVARGFVASGRLIPRRSFAADGNLLQVVGRFTWRRKGAKRRTQLQQLDEFINCHHRVSNEGAKRADRQRLVLRHREIRADADRCHDYVASDLTRHLPAGFFKDLDRVPSRDVGKPGHTVIQTPGFRAGRKNAIVRAPSDPQPTTTRR